MPEDSEQDRVYAVYRSPCRYCGMPITFEKTYGGKFPSHLDTDGKIKGDGRCPKFNHQDADGETGVGDQPASYPSRKKGKATSRSRKNYTPRRPTWNNNDIGNENPRSIPKTIDDGLDARDHDAASALHDGSNPAQDDVRVAPTCYHANVGNDKVHVYQIHPECAPALHAYRLAIRGDPDKSIAHVVARFAQWRFGGRWIASNGLIVSDAAVAVAELGDLATALATTRLCPLDSIQGIEPEQEWVASPQDTANFTVDAIVGGMLGDIETALGQFIPVQTEPGKRGLSLDHAFVPAVVNERPVVMVRLEMPALDAETIASMIESRKLAPEALMGRHVKDATSAFQGTVQAIIGTLDENGNRGRLIQLAQKPGTKTEIEQAAASDIILGIASGEHVYEYIASMLVPLPMLDLLESIGGDHACHAPSRDDENQILVNKVISVILERYPGLLISPNQGV